MGPGKRVDLQGLRVAWPGRSVSAGLGAVAGKCLRRPWRGLHTEHAGKLTSASFLSHASLTMCCAIHGRALNIRVSLRVLRQTVGLLDVLQLLVEQVP